MEAVYRHNDAGDKPHNVLSVACRHYKRCLLTFDIARIFTGESWSGAAGPKDMGLTSVLYIYYQGVQFRNMPVASVMSMVLFLIIMVITVINYKLGDKWVSYD